MRKVAWIAPACAALCFALFSLAILPYPGLQDDEVLFTVPLYLSGGAWFSAKIFGMRIPLMLMGYLGTFKTWLYAGIFEFFPPSRWSVRLPMVLVGVVTIWLTWMWTRRAAGSRAAAFAVALLSTDAVFIVTNTFDWGPVALQHACLMGGLVAIQTWLRSEGTKADRKWLALAFFVWGLGLWDKALLIWPLAGLAVATLCVYPKELRRHLRRGPIAIAVAALLIGALPLDCYNVAHRGDTASANAKLSVYEIPRKMQVLENTLDGSALLGPMVARETGPIEQVPGTLVERLSVSLRRISGDHAHNWMLPAVAVSLVGLVFVAAPVRRVLIFFLLATTVTWLEMAANVGTGGSAHHVILLWPFPCVFVGVAFAGVAERGPRLISSVAIGLVAVLVCGNILNTNEYLADLTLNGGVGGWTDAIYRLAGAVGRYRSGQIGIVDWGYLNGLRMFYEGELKMPVVTDFLRKPVMTDQDRRQLLAVINASDSIFIQHTDDQQLFAGLNERMRGIAGELGYSEQVLRVVHDNQGRAEFEIFRFVKVS